MKVRETGLQRIIDDLHAIADAPDAKTVAALDSVLTAGFLDTQSRTHVLSGSLKASGRMESGVEDGEWQGTISYGGASAGPNSVVDYAIYEMQRGGEHDFFSDLPGLDDRFTDAIDGQFER